MEFSLFFNFFKNFLPFILGFLPRLSTLQNLVWYGGQNTIMVWETMIVSKKIFPYPVHYVYNYNKCYETGKKLKAISLWATLLQLYLNRHCVGQVINYHILKQKMDIFLL